MVTAYGQMRLVTGFEIVNHLPQRGLISGTAGVALWLWTRGRRWAWARWPRPPPWRCG
jgi:ATP-binding cassette subfamily B multidrug efflux pump